MFEIKKAKSRISTVEYLELDLKKIKTFLESDKTLEVKKTYVKGIEKHQKKFSLTKTSTIVLSKNVTKGRKIIKSIEVRIDYVAWIDKDGRPVEWHAAMEFNPNLELVRTSNSQRVRIGEKTTDKKQMYVVFEQGFSNIEAKEPYFLEPYAFDYIYEKEA